FDRDDTRDRFLATISNHIAAKGDVEAAFRTTERIISAQLRDSANQNLFVFVKKSESAESVSKEGDDVVVTQPDKMQKDQLRRKRAAKTSKKSRITDQSDIKLTPRSETIFTASISDQPAKKDRLGFEPYVKAIADFLTNERTVPPLTLSIEGEWGSGKSSFMTQLEGVLRKHGNLTLQFNAWRHDKHEELWAAFAL